MNRILGRFGQRLPLFVRDRDVGWAPDATPTIDAVIVDGAGVSTSIATMEGPVNTGQYAVVLDASGLRVGARVRVLVSYAISSVPQNEQLDAIVTRRIGAVLPAIPPDPPIGAPAGQPVGLATRMAVGASSFTGNYRGIPTHLVHYLTGKLGANTLQISPPPRLPNSITSDSDGYFNAMTLGGMALFPTIDQRAPGNTGTTDFVDAVLAQPLGSYDYMLLTSGFLQDTVGVDGIERQVLAGAGGSDPNQYGVILEIKRRIVQELRDAGIQSRILVRQTQEGYNPNDDANLDDAERRTRLEVIAARQIVAEGVVDAVLPDHYVWSRLMYGAFGAVGSAPSDAVPAYVGLTHANSQQAGGRNYGWLHRSQGTTAPFGTNAHQNAIGTIVAVWTAAYALWGIDPRGDTSFADPAGLLQPLDDFIRPDGQRIYGGHQTGVGNWPYDPAYNPDGPPDVELDLDWSAATQQQIQDRIVAAVDDFYAQTTEFD